MKAQDAQERSIIPRDPKSTPTKTINIMKLCKERGCDTKTKANGYCNKHLKQIRKFGKIIKRTKYDLNEFMIDGDCCRIYLYDANGKKESETIIDADDIEKCKNLKWYYSKKYVYTGGLGPKVVCLSQIQNSLKWPFLAFWNRKLNSQLKSRILVDFPWSRISILSAHFKYNRGRIQPLEAFS